MIMAQSRINAGRRYSPAKPMSKIPLIVMLCHCFVLNNADRNAPLITRLLTMTKIKFITKIIKSPVLSPGRPQKIRVLYLYSTSTLLSSYYYCMSTLLHCICACTNLYSFSTTIKVYTLYSRFIRRIHRIVRHRNKPSLDMIHCASG
jgi:hypothetical protein